MPTVMTFYRFVPLAGLEALARVVRDAAGSLGLKGTVLLAGEGINATLAGRRSELQAFRACLDRVPPLDGVRCRFSDAAEDNPVFHRLKVRIRPEIVRLGRPAAAPAQRAGEPVDARRWNELLDDPEVVVLDTRNRYETAIGTFPGALDPGTGAFRELPDYVRTHLDPRRHPRLAMFCTGGIRCEKASAWLLSQGFERVYQLDGGILQYLETVPPDDNRWQGECFVFDQRVTVNRQLGEGSFEQCYACRRPLSAGDRASADYRIGVSCPHCIDEHDEVRRRGFRERRRQVVLAAGRGERHIGG